MLTPEDEIRINQQEKRRREEKRILATALSLKNNGAEDPEATGDIYLWLVSEAIANGKLLHSIVDALKKLQTIDECAKLRKEVSNDAGSKFVKFKFLGVSYAGPISIGVIAILAAIYFWLHSQGVID